MGKLAGPTATLPSFIDIILPLAVPGVFTYEVPPGLAGKVQPGVRVVAPFGKGRKLYGGLVLSRDAAPPEGRIVRAITDVLDDQPVATARQLELWQAISDHYMCCPGEVMLAAMPAALVLSSATRLVSAAGHGGAWSGDQRQDILLDALEQRHEMSLEEAAALIGRKNPMPVIKKLLESGALLLAEELKEDWKPRMGRFIHLGEAAQGEEALHRWFDELARAPKQLHILMRYVELSRLFSDDPKEVGREELLKRSGATAADLKKMCDKGIFRMEERPVGTPSPASMAKPAPILSDAQRKALAEVRTGFVDHGTVLLHGVTASGKTELYMELMAEVIARGKQVLYLLPEIALTTQVIARMRARFGDRVAAFHSRLSQRERTDLWMHMLRRPEECPVVVGARSAIFLPFHELGLVVVDEEHDPSYKQHDPAPRYNARDMAAVLAGLHKAKVLLGSATPSMESLYNARQGKYGFAALTVRYGNAVLPEIIRVDLGDMQRRKRMKGSFSDPLVEAIAKAVGRKEQAIIFQNRRGYAPAWQCDTCGWVPECEHCDVSLTYHKRDHTLRCHYCGRHYAPPVRCAACGSNRLRMVGLGTEKVEEELALLLPDAKVARMDQDTTRGKHGFERLLSRFGEGAIDILVGTQMVTKGLDFNQVTVVGILNADNLMRFPDFRAHERAFQLMAQVAGRSGRKKDPGTVFIQGRDIHHPIIDMVARHDVEAMYHREIALRQAHSYPPFSRMVRLLFKDRDEARVQGTAQAMADSLRPVLGDRVLGPEPPPVARVRDKYLRVVLLKLARGHYRSEKTFLRDAIDRLFVEKPHRSVQLQVDVDPA